MYYLNISAHVNSSVRRTSALWTSRWLSATICYQVRHLTVGLTANHLSNNYQRTNDRGGITGGSGHFTRLRQLSWLPPMRWWGHTSSEVIFPPMRAFHQWVLTAELCTISIEHFLERLKPASVCVIHMPMDARQFLDHAFHSFCPSCDKVSWWASTDSTIIGWIKGGGQGSSHVFSMAYLSYIGCLCVCSLTFKNYMSIHIAWIESFSILMLI